MSNLRLVDQQNSQPYSSANHNQTHQAGGNTLESLKSSVRGGLSSRNANISPQKTPHDDKGARMRQTRPLYVNTRANSEPPTDFINQRLPVPEEVKENQQIQEGQNFGSFQTKGNPLKVPPIMVDQIKQNQNAPAVLSGFQSTSTSVMNNFFNMPHGERFQTQLSAVRANSSATKTSLYKYQNQSMLAQTRLTRRQFSISRGGATKQEKSQPRDSKLKTSQSPTREQNPYSDDSVNNRVANAIVPTLNLNQVKVFENNKSKSIERPPSTFVNIPPQQQQISDEGEDQDASMQLETQLLGAGQSAEQKLKQLATQLGESCLTNDLAALVSQKRELDLAMTARKVVHKPEYLNQMSKVASMKRSMTQIVRHNSSSYLLLQKSRISQDIQHDFKPKQLQNNEVTRLVLLNMIDLVLQDYTIEEARFLRKPTSLFTCYLNSDFSRDQRRDIQIQELLNGADFKHQHKKSNYQDPEYRYIYQSLVKYVGPNMTEKEVMQSNSLFDSNMTQIQQALKTSDIALVAQRSSLLAFHQELFCKCKLLSESRVVQRILQKFSFVNEDIVKTQTVNELSSFTNRESNQNSKPVPHSISANSLGQSPLKVRNSFQTTNDDGSQLNRNGGGRDCISQISNPYQLWSNNGIGYDLTQTKDRSSTYIDQNHIKRTLDGVLHQVSRRIVSIFNQGFDLTCYDFADALTAEITALTIYMEDHRSRLVLQQFIDVCLGPIFMVKNALKEVTLEMRILAQDFTKPNQNGNQTAPDTTKSGKNKSVNSDQILDSENQQPNLVTMQAEQMQEDVRFEPVRCQRRLRDLFSEFLLLISMILKRTQTEETLKLLNEVFVFDEMWNESVKAFTISLFLADLISPVFQKDLNSKQLEICQQLRGVNIINFDEKSYFDTLILLKDQSLMNCAKESIYHYFIQAESVLRYLKGVTNFFVQVNQMYFPRTFQPSAKKVPTDSTDPTQHYNSFVNNGINTAANPLVQKPIVPNQDETQDKQTQKYWKHVIRRVLYQFMYLIVHPNGLFYLYLQKNCLNYSKQDVQNTTRSHRLFTQTALNLKITSHVLGFLQKIFDMPNQFTKYVFGEELMLFYIRTHYISFVKLYNKNFKKGVEQQREPGTFVPSIELCKRHVECLFAIAKQRTDDTRRKLYQFKIASFLLQEIGLEYELQQRQQTFLKFRQQEQVKLKKPAPGAEVKKEQSFPQTSVPVKKSLIPSLKIAGLGLSTLVNENGKTQEEQDVENLVKLNKAPLVVVEQPVQQLPKKVPFIPQLKVGGLGLSTLVKENGKTQEEIDVEAQVKLNKIQPQAMPEALPLNQQQPHPEQQPQQIKKAPLIPSLKVGGLGFSTLIKDNGKTQEELDVENLIKKPVGQTQQIQIAQQINSEVTDDSEYEFEVHQSNRSLKQKSNRQTKNQDGEGSSSDESYYRELERIKSMPPPPPPKTALSKPGFKLSLGGLGLSTLVKENGKTQEELDVDATVKQGKVAVIPEKMKTIEDVQAKNFSRNMNFDKTEPTKELRQIQVAPQANVRASAEMPRELIPGRSPDIISGFDQSQMSSLMVNNQGLKVYKQQSSLPLAQVITQLQSAGNMNMEDLMDAQEFAREQELPTESQVVQKDVTEEMLYLNERTVRPIYQDEDLHILMLSLMMCLLLKPQRGTLDELYCSQFPVDNENQNFLYLLHFHLSHPQNQDIVPRLLEKMESVSPQLAGQRLLKLLCPSLFDLSLYGGGKGWIKLAEGAYGVVYEVESSMAEPKTVAIKKMNLPQTIYDRCVLHDIFTEITCLEEFRLEQCVTDLYDYGVDGTCYYIVMKKYAGSLRDWRLKQSTAMQDNMSLYLSIYREILKCFKTIHSHNVTHYDIKGDNILIDFKSGTNQSNQNLFDVFAITVGDFGECHMYTTDKDEFQSRNKGTEHIKSPEMLQLAIATRKDTDKYDRRKRVGTNSLSDVWGLGCLFYELLTGDVLFQTEEYFEFHMRLTDQKQPLIPNEKLEKINNNVYLIDFLKYVLVRDMRLRPTIDNVLKRFEHIHALLVATSSHNSRFNSRSIVDNIDPLHSNRGSRVQLSTLLERAATIIENNGKAIEVDQLLSYSGSGASIQHQATQLLDVISLESREKHMPEMMRIMEDVFIASNFWLQRRSSKAIKLGITHVVLDKSYSSRQTKDMFEVLELDSKNNNAFKLVPTIMDFLRKVALLKGRVLFIETRDNLADQKFKHESVQDQLNSESNESTTLTEAMLICLSAMYQTSAYESYTLIKSQNLFFKIETQRLVEISNFVKICDRAQTYLMTYPQFSCICGACVIILKRSHATYQNMQIVTCRCCHYYKNVEQSQCPSTGCNDLVTFLQTYYIQHVQKQNMLPDGKLHWGFVNSDDFMFGPNRTGCNERQLQRQVALNLSQTIDVNSHVAAVTDKISLPDQLSSTTIRQKYTRVQNHKPNYNQVQQAPSMNVQEINQWRLMKCINCNVWTHAFNQQFDRYAILLNNRLKDSQKEQRLGLLTRSSVGKQNQTVSVPILKKIKMQTPF